MLHAAGFRCLHLGWFRDSTSSTECSMPSNLFSSTPQSKWMKQGDEAKRLHLWIRIRRRSRCLLWGLMDWSAIRCLAQLRPLIVLSWELQTQKTSMPQSSKKMPGGFQLCYILLPNPDNGMSNMSSATRICKSVNVLTLVDSSALSSTCRRFGTKGFDSAAVQ